jgi:HK97 family phage portal protein
MLDQNGRFLPESSAEFRTEQSAFVDNMTLKNLFYTEDWVFICTDSIAAPISQLPLYVNDIMSDRGSAKGLTYSPNHAHPLNKVIERPNKFQDRHAFLYNQVVDFCQLGNAVFWFAEQLGEMYQLGAELVQYDFDQQRNPVGMFYYPMGYEDGFMNKAMKNNFPLAQLCHTMRPNPSSLLWGLSPYIPGKRSTLINRYSSEYVLSFYQKGASPQFILEMPENTNKKQMQDLLRTMEISTTGRRNQRRPMVLPPGVKANSHDSKIVDQNLVELVRNNRETILQILRIPKHIVSLNEAGSLGSEEAKMALKVFWLMTLNPICEMIEGRWTQFFRARGLLRQNECLRFDKSSVAALEDDEESKAKLAISLMPLFTPNELRSKFYDAPPIVGGDVIASQNSQPQLPMFYGAAPQPQPTPQAQALPAPIEATKEVEPPTIDTTSTKGPDTLPNALSESAKAVFEQTEKDYKDQEENQIPEVFDLALELLSKSVVKASSLFKKFASEKAATVDKERYRKELDKSYEEIHSQYRKKFDDRLESSIDVGYRTSLSPLFNKEDQAALAAAQEEGRQGRRAILEARSIKMFDSIRNTSTESVMKIIDRALTEKLSVQDTAKLLVSTFSGLAESRALTIARTETLTAVSLGQAALAQDAAKMIPGLKKVWMNAGDLRVRGTNPWDTADHVKLQAEERDFDKPFSNGLMFPRDPSGPANQTINCFIGSTIAQSVKLKASISHVYEGEFVTLKTISGRELTGTQNHPVMTRFGWMALGQLQKGDELICASLNLEAPICPDMEQINATMEEVHGSLSRLGSAQRVVSAGGDFHGDVTHADVDVVWADRSLHLGVKASSDELSKEFGLVSSDVLPGSASGHSSFGQLSGGSLDSSDSSVRSGDLPRSLVGTHSGPLDSFSLRSTPDSNSGLDKSSANRWPRDSQIPGKSVLAPEFINVTMDQIVDVQRNFGRHNVYNLHTDSEQYLANGIVVHNCRCTLLVIPPEDRRSIKVPKKQEGDN